ncbi:DUF4386 domain-containing protein [Fulvivirgaceae bacterium BMA12]|uniref:DUF4386 domain-containing protein n=1 Tax=Agaribacillus aureus TaxID=3051825 RepID=A0ABT8L0R4_9BACT|nr:DUF4386 domain-containing protein [Fulvivirgaceae bacterium BMA12]
MNYQIQKAALISGIGIFIMVLSVPVAEFVIFPDLFDYGNAEITFKNIQKNRELFVTGIFLHTITLICDVVVAWALYIFLRPVNRDFSLLISLFRIVFTVVTLSALLNLVGLLNLTQNAEYLSAFDQSLYAKVLLSIKNFNLQWSFAFVFFGTYLIMLGILVFQAFYVPRIFGILLIIAGAGYLIDTLRIFFFPSTKMDYLMITFFGELVFMLWLLIKGWRVKVFENNKNQETEYNKDYHP